MLHSVKGNLLASKEKYIVHQCNCVTTRAAHLAHSIFKRFPYSDIYSPRDGKDGDTAHVDSTLNPEAALKPYEDKPGDIIIRGNGDDQRYVIALLGQYFPGFARYPDSKKDGVKARQQYFYQGLLKIAQIPSLKSIAFPYGIGCGAAGGDLAVYSKMIWSFAKHLEGKSEVYVYHLEDS